MALLNKRDIILLSLLVISLITVSLYQTLATDVTMNKTNSTDADLSYIFDITDQTGRVVNVKAGATKVLDIFVTNSNNGTINYGIAYTPSSVKTDDTTIAQLSTSKDSVSGLINKDERKQITLVIINNSTSDITLSLVAVTGYEHGGDLIVPSNHTLITEEYEMEVLKDPLSIYIENLYSSANDKTSFNDAGNGTKYERTPSQELMKDTAGNIRYYGEDPNNYVKFNNELWRIIGVFKDVDDGTGKKELRVKIVRNDSIGDNKWNNTTSNEWSTSTLKNTLNSTYLQSLTIESQKMIGNTLWNLGAWNGAKIYANQFYQYERGTTVYNGRTTYWTGKIALIYPSDYMYAGDLSKCSKTGYAWDSDVTNCRDKSWLKDTNKAQWTLQPNSSSEAIIFYIGTTGFIRSNSNNATTAYSVRPSLYLKSETILTGRDGTKENPYTVDIETDIEPSQETGANYIESLLLENPTTMNNDDPNGNVRYMGTNPNNYVKFNNELWRIIGVFNVASTNGGLPEKRLKIIKNESLGEIAWDSGNINDWTKSSLKEYLNGDYFNSLSSEAQKMLEDTYWNLGGTGEYTNSSNGLTSHFYGYERGTTVYSGRSTYWVGKIGLMYPSDYGYATSGGTTTNRASCLAKELYRWSDSSYNDCKNNNYLYESSMFQWTMTSNSSNSTYVFFVDINASLSSNSNASLGSDVRPAVYLNSSILIKSGNGSQNNPYILGF